MIKQGFTTSARKHLKEKKPKPSKYKVRPNGYGNRKTHNKFNQSEEVTVAKDECSDEFHLSAIEYLNSMNECTILVQDLFNAVVRNDSYGPRRFKSKLLEHHGDKIHIVNDGKNPSLVILRKKRRQGDISVPF